MARKGSARSLLEQIAGDNVSKANDFDPEDQQGANSLGSESASESGDEEAGREHYVAVGSVRLEVFIYYLTVAAAQATFALPRSLNWAYNTKV